MRQKQILSLLSLLLSMNTLLSYEIQTSDISNSLEQQESIPNVLIPYLQGVLLVADQSSVEKGGVDVQGFQSNTVIVPGGMDNLNHKLGPAFIGKSLDKDQLVELKRQLIVYYRDQGHPVVAVEIPEQGLSKGTLQLVVIESVVGKISVHNNKYFSSKQIKSNLREKEGDPISSDKLLSDVAWINQNPFRHVDLILSPGEQLRTTDIDLYVKDQFPLQGYVGADNTGIASTGQARFFTGFHYGNLFGLGHMLTYQFTMSANYHKFWAHTLYYNAPLFWRHKLLIYGGYSEIHPDIPNFKSKGRNTQASLRYQIPLNGFYNGFIHEITGGFDFKKINSNLFFAEQITVPIVSHAVNITQLYGSYSLGKKTTHHKVNLKLEGIWSPGQIIGDQSNQDFSDLQPGAVNHYFYGRGSIADTWTLPKDFSIVLQARGQGSTQNLIASEQFTLGGYDTVRGYPEHEFNYDDAVCFNFEFYLPPFHLFRSLKKHPDEMKILGFFDYGTGRDVYKEYEPQWQKLMSVGPGLRYKITDYLSARIDWGFRLHKVAFTGYGSRVHMGILASF